MSVDLSQWNAVDLILVGIALLLTWRGWRRGFILGAIDLFVWIASILLALRFNLSFAQLLITARLSPVWAQPIAFMLIILVAGTAISLLGNALIRRLPPESHIRLWNRILGLLPGLANGLITTAIISALLLAVPLPGDLETAIRDSRLVNPLASQTASAESALAPIFGPAVQQTFGMFTIHPESNERVDLPFSVRNAPARPDLEARMLTLVNAERAKAGLNPLANDPQMVVIARQHSDDMLARGYFAHETPEGQDPFARMQAAGIRFSTAGENLALAPTLDLAHQGLMNSPEHRANILRPQFGRVGIGILDGGIRGLMITQDFRD